MPVLTAPQTRVLDLLNAVDAAVTASYTDTKTKKVIIPRAEAAQALIGFAAALLAMPDGLSAPVGASATVKAAVDAALARFKALSPADRVPETDRTYLP